MKKLTRILSGLLLAVFAAPAIAQVTDDDIDRAREEVNRLTEQSSELGQEVIDAYGRQFALDAEIASLEQSIEFAEIRIAETESRVEDLAVELYMGSTSGSSLSVLFTATNEAYPAGMEYLREASGVDANVVNQLRVMRNELDTQTARLGEALEEQEILAAELEEKSGELQVQLVDAQQVYDDLVTQQEREEEERRRREEEERRRRAAEAAAATSTSTTSATTPTTTQGSEDTAAPTTTAAPSPTTTAPPATTTTSSPPSSSGGGACPVAGAVSFTDSWGAPRSGGRSHKGVDMMAARGVPIVAIYSGTVYRLSNSSLGGKSVYFNSDAGDMYYYAHLDDFADISPGQHLSEGDVLGYNGSTGNAPPNLPHLHFEYHPGGGAAVNPYPLVRGLC
ncbi:MAG: murein hydrolase activator EnvC family protein [Actinomycetota bacterium]